MVLIALAFVLFRIALALIVLFVRAVYLLVFAPIGFALAFPWRAQVAPSARPRQRNLPPDDPASPESFGTNFARLINAIRGVPDPVAPAPVVEQEGPAEPSRNQLDTERTLLKLGWPAKQSRRVAAKVAAELGRDADLDKMVRRAMALAQAGG